MNTVTFYDTTLRDGLRNSGVTLSLDPGRLDGLGALLAAIGEPTQDASSGVADLLARWRVMPPARPHRVRGGDSCSR